MVRLLFTTFIILLVSSIYAQEINLVGSFYNDGVYLRWATKNDQLLTVGKNIGYTIFKEVYQEQQLIEKKQIVIKPQIIEKGNSSKLIANSTDEAAYEIFINLETDVLNTDGDKNADEWKSLSLLFGLDHNFLLAQQLGLGWMDTVVDRNYTYQYSIYLNELKSNIIRLNYLDTIEMRPLDSMHYLCRNNYIQLTLPIDSGLVEYSSFNVEKSNGGTTFVQLNKLPLVPNLIDGQYFIYYRDTILKTDLPEYRIRGKNLFGKYGPYAPLLEVEPCHIVFRPPTLFRVIEIPGAQLFMEWSLDSILYNKVLGFNVYSALSSADSFLQINNELLSEDTRSFIDPSPTESTFYKIEVVYKNGKRLISFPVLGLLKDITAPNSPMITSADFDTSTFVATIQWTVSEAPDIKGYKLYYHHGIQTDTHTFHNNAIKDTFYVDTLVKDWNLRTRHYFVTALDQNLNESYFSSAKQIKIPDVQPPKKARITRIERASEHVTVFWDQSSSPDVHLYNLQSSVDNQNWNDVHTLYSAESKRQWNSYIDTSNHYSDSVYYRVMSLDSSGLSSYSNARKGWKTKASLLANIEFVEATIKSKDSIVELFWDYPNDIGIYKFEIYTAQENQNLISSGIYYAQDVIIQNGIKKKNRTRTYTLYGLKVPSKHNYTLFQIRGYDRNGNVTPMTPIFTAK